MAGYRGSTTLGITLTPLHLVATTGDLIEPENTAVFYLDAQILGRVAGIKLEAALCLCFRLRKEVMTMMNIPDEILTAVKGFVYKFGHIEPMVFVFGTQGKLYMPLPFGQTSDDRAEIMTRAGIQLAKAGGIGDVEKVIYVSEAWVSPSRTPIFRLHKILTARRSCCSIHWTRKPTRRDWKCMSVSGTDNRRLQTFRLWKYLKKATLKAGYCPPSWPDSGYLNGSLSTCSLVSNAAGRGE